MLPKDMLMIDGEIIGDRLWACAVSRMEQALKLTHCTDAIVNAVHEIGEALSQHFPVQGDHGNELPDRIIKD